MFSMSSAVIQLYFADISTILYKFLHNLPMILIFRGISDQQQQHPASGHCKNALSQPKKVGQLQG